MARSIQEYPTPIRVMRTLFPLLEKIFPSIAVNAAVKLFLTPFNFGFSPSEKQHIGAFRKINLTAGSFEVVGYEIGEGPRVLCLHGWSGRGMQFYRIALALADSGYSCLLLDAPAHGLSKGKISNLFEFAEVFTEVQSQYDDIIAVAGHSLGAASISFAISEGNKVPAFICLGAPVVAKDILSDFASKLNLSPQTIEGIREKAVLRFNRSFESVAMESTFKKVDCPVLALHGIDDFDVPVYHLDVLKSINPDIQTRSFEGIGHRRILKDDRVIDVIKDWLIKLDQRSN